jgi:hypothetical protein
MDVSWSEAQRAETNVIARSDDPRNRPKGRRNGVARSDDRATTIESE